MRPSLENSSILVTGGAGFIGSHLVDRLLDIGVKKCVIDNCFWGLRIILEMQYSGALFL